MVVDVFGVSMLKIKISQPCTPVKIESRCRSKKTFPAFADLQMFLVVTRNLDYQPYPIGLRTVFRKVRRSP